MGRGRQGGFTLIELSIVLVIIGLIVGGVLTGRDLIRAAEVRAQISEIQKLNTTVNAFRDKYGGLPGDLSPSLVTQFGFSVVPTRTGTNGQGNADGLLEGGITLVDRACCTSGETAWFWEDLTANSKMMEGYYSYAGTSSYTGGNNISAIWPPAKIGDGNYLSVYTSGGFNYFDIIVVTGYDTDGATYSNPGLTVAQAFAIDNKIDDGFPQTGRVTAQYQNWSIGLSYDSGLAWAAGGGVSGNGELSATPGSATTCYDNGSTAGAKQQYSLSQSNGAGVNCALSFRMQAGD